MNVREVRAFVDRIEGPLAVLLLGEEERHSISLPSEYLPDGVGEGSVLTIIIRDEPDHAAEARNRVSGLIERLRRSSGENRNT